MNRAVGAFGSDAFEATLLKVLQEHELDLDAFTDDYAEDIRWIAVTNVEDRGNSIRANVDVSFTDVTLTGCSDVQFTKGKSLVATIEIWKKAPYDFDLEFEPAWEVDGDYF